MKKCIIMGNGPSLNDMPEDLLLKYDSFGVNYAKHQPTYYVCVDTDILLNHWIELYPRAAGAKKCFLSERHRGSSPLYTMPGVELVTHDKGAFLGEHFFTGLTVVYVALKCAFYMGYDRVDLWGVDHSPAWDHYRADYPPPTNPARESLMEVMFWHYKLAAKVYSDAGRRIINHSYKSKLDEIFER